MSDCKCKHVVEADGTVMDKEVSTKEKNLEEYINRLSRDRAARLLKGRAKYSAQCRTTDILKETSTVAKHILKEQADEKCKLEALKVKANKEIKKAFITKALEASEKIKESIEVGISFLQKKLEEVTKERSDLIENDIIPPETFLTDKEMDSIISSVYEESK